MNFKYTKASVPQDCKIRISPSSIAKFFEFPVNWYKDNFEDGNSFTGNTGSELGTIIHAVAEAVAGGKEVYSQEIEKYIEDLPESDDIDKEVIRENYREMAHALVNQYILKNRPNKVEQSVYDKIIDDIYVAGTYDGFYFDGTVVDYKNEARKPNTDTIPFKYKIQLLAYARMIRSTGLEVTRIRIVYTVRRTKTLPVRVFVVNHMITLDDWKMIDDTLMLMAETINLQREHPEYIHLLYKSMNLKKPAL